jgi:creatinine amidohydrolase
VANDAAAPLGVPVFPVLAYGLTPYFMAFPGSVSLRLTTYAAVVRDILDSLYATGFRRVLIVNGHGGNSPVQPVTMEWMAEHQDARCRFHDWWKAPATWEAVQSVDPVASHASWMENFPWTRLEGRDMPTQQKPYVNFNKLRDRNAAGVRAEIGDGNYGGYYQKPDEDMQRIWDVAVSETRELMKGEWA